MAALLLLLPFLWSSSQADIRFILQTQAGITAYTSIESDISLIHARQFLTSIETETADFIYGQYILAGRSDSVQLAIGADGWIVAFHPANIATAHWLDCAGSSQPEQAVLEVATALGYPAPVIGFYDARYPAATAVAIHWLYTEHGSQQSSNITLPIANLYLDRGYTFCTALTNSQFWLNDQRLEFVGALSQVVR